MSAPSKYDRSRHVGRRSALCPFRVGEDGEVEMEAVSQAEGEVEQSAAAGT